MPKRIVPLTGTIIRKTHFFVFSFLEPNQNCRILGQKFSFALSREEIFQIFKFDGR
jgi:hypothetical protein